MSRSVSSTKREIYIAAAVCILLPSGALGAELPKDGPEIGYKQTSTVDAGQLCLRGDSFFRNAEFARAKALYEAAVSLDHASARANLGLGRIARIEFRRK